MFRVALSAAIPVAAGLVMGAAALSGGECPIKAAAAAATGQGATCSQPADAVAVNAAGEGATCTQHPVAVNANAAGEGAACTKPADDAQAIAVNAAGQGGACCQADAAAAIVASGQGAACTQPAKAVAVNASGHGAACTQPADADAVAVGNPDATPIPVGLFSPINAQCTNCSMPPNEAFTSVVSGFTVGFCNANCKADFDAKPAAEQTAFVASQVQATVVNTTCPGSGQPVTEGTVALYQGFAVGFCCDDCKATWEQGDDAAKVAYIASQHPAENAACPASGEPVNAEVVALHRGHTVGFCCENCQAKFNAKTGPEKDAVIAALAVAAPAAPDAEACAACAAGTCDGSCKTDA